MFECFCEESDFSEEEPRLPMKQCFFSAFHPTTGCHFGKLMTSGELTKNVFKHIVYKVPGFYEEVHFDQMPELANNKVSENPIFFKISPKIVKSLASMKPYKLFQKMENSSCDRNCLF